MFSYLIDLLRQTLSSIMSYFGVNFGATRSLPPSTGLQVFIRTNFGEQTCITLEPSWTVKKVKSNIAAKLNTSEENLKIIFAGKVLPDELLIEQCDLGNRSILHAVRIETNNAETLDASLSDKPRPIVDKPSLRPLPENSIKACSSDVRLSEKVENTTSHSSLEHVPSTSGNTVSAEDSEKIMCLNDPRTRLLCDASTIMTIQLSEMELQELQKLKASGADDDKPHFYVYCMKPCSSVQVGKLRVRCQTCKSGAVTVHRDPANWQDVLVSEQIASTCEYSSCDGKFAEFYFKCKEHETLGEDDTAVVLYLIRANLPRVPCLACTDISTPIIVFQCASAHVMCLDCFITYCLSRLNERQFVRDDKFGYTLPCPVGCSDSLIEEIHHFKLMGEQHYDRYQRFGTEEALLAAGGVMCPRPGCGQGILPDEDCRRIKCINGCDYVFCKDCLQGYHIGECVADNAYYGDSTGSSLALNPDRVALSRWDEATSITIRVMTKPCPKCRTPTERDGGCMHMVCTRASCQFNWCWVCQTEWTRECMAAHWFG